MGDGCVGKTASQFLNYHEKRLYVASIPNTVMLRLSMTINDQKSLKNKQKIKSKENWHFYRIEVTMLEDAAQLEY